MLQHQPTMVALFGRYEYERELGRGASGRVFAARDLAEGGALRALKVVDGDERAPLLWEFERLGRVEHTSVARVRELLRVESAVHAPYALAAGSLVLVEDAAPGAPLSRIVPPPDMQARVVFATRVAVEVAEALTAIHDAGLVHGDVKPDNVLVDESSMRVTLVDLGFAGPPALREAARGTPRYMAPELFSGLRSYAADVYAVGALLFDWLMEARSERSGSGAIHGFLVRDVAPLRAMAPAPFVDALAQLLAADPAMRPSDGQALRQLLAPLAAQLGVRLFDADALLHGVRSPTARAARARALPFVGRSAELSALEEALQQGGLVLVRGAQGAGRSRLIREATRRLQLSLGQRAGAMPSVVHTFDGLDQLHDVGAILWLEPEPDELEAQLDRAARLLSIRERPLTVVVECAPLQQREGARIVDIAGLPADQLTPLLEQLLMQRPLAGALVRAAGDASQHLAGRLCLLVADLLGRGIDVLDPRSFDAANGACGAGLSSRANDLAGLFAWWDGALTPDDCVHSLVDADGRDAAFAELWANGALIEKQDGLVLAPAVARQMREVARARRRELVESIATSRVPRSGFALLALGREAEAAQAFGREADKLRARGEVDGARRLLADACRELPTTTLHLAWADAERARADYTAALQVLAALEGSDVLLMRAEVARLAGQRDSARELATELTVDGDARVQGHARALLARLAFDAGDADGARDQIAHCLAHGDAAAAVRALEVRVLVQMREGALQRDSTEQLVDRARMLPNRRALGRALSLRSQLAGRLGEKMAALADAREALRCARDAGELHEAATFALNLGLLQLDAGELGPALETLREAAYRLSRIGRPGDMARMLFNLAAASLSVGDDARAQLLLRRAEEYGDKLDAQALALIAVLDAELALRRGQPEQATAKLSRAWADTPEQLGGTRALLAARSCQVELLLGDIGSAQRSLLRATTLSHRGDAALSCERVVAELRLALAMGDLSAAQRGVEQGMQVLAQAPFGEAVRVMLAAIDVARAVGDESAVRERSALCRARLESALASLPPPLRAQMRERPEYARVLAASLPLPHEQGDHEGAGRWRRLVAGSRRLFTTLSRMRIAEEAVAVALDLVHAERALLIACTDQGELEVRARAELAVESKHVPPFSRSVVERVWSERASLVTVDAADDARLHSAQSIHALHVRSVLAVPVSGLGEPAVLYLDDRVRSQAFCGDDLALIEDLAALVSEALKAARFTHEQRRRTRKAEEEASALARVIEQNAAANGDSRRAPLVGVSRALLHVTETARRIAASDVSLLITGDSGTGKELLARYVHEQSPRAARAFVAESCAALPDTLLESALFGHVRGAFTGADKARRGLFEIADQGTLFLDEVGEMSPTLQAKLLRVLQEGEFRPVGSERTKRVNVRVIAATRRDLPAQARVGQFREDLFYRLAVVTLELPSLERRREDIPLLVRHFVDKHQPKGRTVRVSPAALRAFAQRDYPGNVRQLENEVRRALALCRDDLIDIADLPESAQPVVASHADDDLSLHVQLDAMTRKLVEEAMARASGNVTQAAQLLGISRFGLQKMLKRYAPQTQRK